MIPESFVGTKTRCLQVPILLVGNKMDTVKSVNDIPPEHDDLEVFARKRRIETLRISAKNLDQVGHIRVVAGAFC